MYQRLKWQQVTIAALRKHTSINIHEGTCSYSNKRGRKGLDIRRRENRPPGIIPEEDLDISVKVLAVVRYVNSIVY